MHNDQAVTLLISALGGEGGGVLADWLVDTARACGHAVQGTSIPGVAQRTGATTYYVEIFPIPTSELSGRQPVFGLYAVPGGLDLLVGSELLEAVRQAGNGLVSPDRTTVLVSSARTLTTLEKMQMADGRFDPARLQATLRTSAAELRLLDMATLAQQQGTVISAVMFGALAGWACSSGRLPFARAAYEATITRSGKGVEPSLRGFGAAFDAVAGAAAPPPSAPAPGQPEAARPAAASASASASNAAPPAAPAALTITAGTSEASALPAPVAEIAALGQARLLDYQDAAYATLYLQRLQRIVAAERQADASGCFAASTEAARWLALWMAFDDIVRVADLKSRASRWQRVQREVKLGEHELLKLFDHFKPGVPELAALLPQRWADALQRWDRRRVQRGLAPWALPLAIGSHTVLGLLALRTLAALKGQRRRGSRYATEQALIARWLAATAQGLAELPALGLAIAGCGRLIKGYGSTNERGKHNLLHLIDHLAFASTVGDATQRAKAVASACAAALADEAGQGLDQALQAHGAPPRPVPAQPIRWHRRKPAAAGPLPPP